jgi:hypothetical protein
MTVWKMCAAESMGVAVHRLVGRRRIYSLRIGRLYAWEVQIVCTEATAGETSAASEVFNVLELSDGATGHSLP